MRAGDGRFLATVAAALALVAASVGGRLLEPEPVGATGGARRIDAGRIERLVRDGTLSDREALFYRPAGPPGAAGTGGPKEAEGQR